MEGVYIRIDKLFGAFTLDQVCPDFWVLVGKDKHHRLKEVFVTSNWKIEVKLGKYFRNRFDSGNSNILLLVSIGVLSENTPDLCNLDLQRAVGHQGFQLNVETLKMRINFIFLDELIEDLCHIHRALLLLMLSHPIHNF